MPRRLASSDATEPGETDVVDQGEHEVGRARARSDELLQPLDVGGEVDHALGVALVVEAPGELVEVDDRRLFAHPVGDAWVERSRRTAQRLADVVGRERPAATGGRQPQPGEHGAHRGPIGELEPDTSGDGHVRPRPARPGRARASALTRASTATSEVDAPLANAVSTARRDAPTASTDVSTDHPPAVDRRGTDRLGDAPVVVPEQPIDHLDHAGRAAVVHLERMLARAGEQLGEVDQPRRIGAVVAVDRLVVVAHAEHRAARRGEEPDQEEVRRCEVLELVDQHDPTGALRSPTGVGSRSSTSSAR